MNREEYVVVDYDPYMATFMQGFMIFCFLLWLVAAAFAGAGFYKGHNLQNALAADQPAVAPNAAASQ